MAAILDRAGQEEWQQPRQECGCRARELNSTPSFTEASKALRGEMHVQGWGACTSSTDKVCVCGEGSKRAGGGGESNLGERTGCVEGPEGREAGFCKCLMWKGEGGAPIWSLRDM